MVVDGHPQSMHQIWSHHHYTMTGTVMRAILRAPYIHLLRVMVTSPTPCGDCHCSCSVPASLKSLPCCQLIRHSAYTILTSNPPESAACGVGKLHVGPNQLNPPPSPFWQYIHIHSSMFIHALVCNHTLISNASSYIQPKMSPMHSHLLSCQTPHILYPLTFFCTHFHTHMSCIVCLLPLTLDATWGHVYCIYSITLWCHCSLHHVPPSTHIRCNLGPHLLHPPNHITMPSLLGTYSVLPFSSISNCSFMPSSFVIISWLIYSHYCAFYSLIFNIHPITLWCHHYLVLNLCPSSHDHVNEMDWMNTYLQLQDTECFPHLPCLVILFLSGQQVCQKSWSTFFSIFPHITHFSLWSESDEVIWTNP